MAHIFHNHQHGQRVISSVVSSGYDPNRFEKEFEADRTGAQCLQSTNNMISATLIIPIANELFPSLAIYSDLHLADEEKFSIVCAISSALIKTYPDLGTLGDCSTHTQFAHNINKAAEVIKNTQYSEKYTFFSPKIKKLEPCDQQNICSLIYNQLVTRCIETEPLPGNYKIRLEPETHPVPGERKAAILALM